MKWTHRWNFPSNNFGPIFGIADSGVETFKGTPIKSLAREICQNSLDANDQSGQPSKIVFQPFELTPADIPDFAGLQDALKKALKFWSVQKLDDKAKSFFSAALSVAQNGKIPCLRISDYHTTGLTGAREEYHSAWCNLTKATGASDKSGSNGGSFGIGKYAPFACSSFRTVFYSTADNEGHCAYQGVSRLTSFKNKDGEITQGTGFYGGEKNSPVHEQLSLDPSFQRKTTDHGTDIFIIGFNGDRYWREQMIASILDGFLYAVHQGTLVADVDGIEIRQDRLSDLVVSYKDYFQERADEYYQTLVADTSSRTFEKELSDDPETCGKLTLCMMIMPGFHRRVAMVRQTGMKIQDKGHISGIIPFAGVLYIAGDALNTYLRTLENPQHLTWEVERAKNKKKAKNLLKQFMQFIRESLDEMRHDDSEEALDPPLGEYLSADPENEAKNKARTENILDFIHEIDVRETEIKTPVAEASDEQEQEHDTHQADEAGDIIVSDLPGEGGSNSQGAHGKGCGNGPQPGFGNEYTPAEHRKSSSPIPANHVRSLVRDRENGAYTILFTPVLSASDGVLEVFMSAESQVYAAKILRVSCPAQPNLVVMGNKIRNVVFTKHQSLRIDIFIDYHDFCSMEVRAYGNKT